MKMNIRIIMKTWTSSRKRQYRLVRRAWMEKAPRGVTPYLRLATLEHYTQ